MTDCSHALTLAALALSFAAAAALPAQSQMRSGAAIETGASGLPVPRFASLKAQPVNLRKGPGLQYPTAWVLKRAGMPLEITREFEAWRQVRDAEGTTGWVHRSLLSGRRTAVVQPWDVKAGAARPIFDVRARASAASQIVVRFEAGALVGVARCDGTWCRVFHEAYSGYLQQKNLWGVYPREIVR